VDAVTTDPPIAALTVLVKRVIGERPVHLIPVAGGDVNRVYRAIFRSCAPAIVRVGGAGTRFEGERWALARCRSVAVPVPTVRAVEPLPGTDRTVCVEDELGHNDLLTMSRRWHPDRSRAAFADAGRLAAAIHAVAVDGFGYVDAHGSAPRDTWEDIMLRFSDAATRPSLHEAAAAFAVPAAVVDAAAEAIVEHRDAYAGVPSRLLHGDLTPRHFRVLADGRLGVIDMEDAGGGDPLHDLAWWSYWPAHRPWTASFLDGYGLARSEQVAQRVLLARLRIGLGLLLHYAPMSDPRGGRVVGPNVRADVAACARLSGAGGSPWT
jgi:hypothetical protein